MGNILSSFLRVPQNFISLIRNLIFLPVSLFQRYKAIMSPSREPDTHIDLSFASAFLPPPLPPLDYVEIKANFYVTSLRPRISACPHVTSIRIPEAKDWFDHQAIVFKVRKYLLSKQHDIRVYSDNRWSIVSKDSNEIRELLRWCHLVRTSGLERADRIMSVCSPYLGMEKDEIFGIIDPYDTYVLGLFGLERLGKYCSFLCGYNGMVRDINAIKDRLAHLPIVLTETDYQCRIDYARLGKIYTNDELNRSCAKWFPGVDHVDEIVSPPRRFLSLSNIANAEVIIDVQNPDTDSGAHDSEQSAELSDDIFQDACEHPDSIESGEIAPPSESEQKL